MCRIGGLWSRGNALPEPLLLRRLRQMSQIQAHGGPDGEGFWIHPEKPLGLLHRRLAIIDLSPAGAQPMARGPLTLSYNGEIYNYSELRQTLIQKGYVFTSGSDTEVLLHGWQAWGPDLLPLLRGMWAFALWDGASLYLVRDRFGVKPLFYALQEAELLFASELPAILIGLYRKPSPYLPALPQYLAYGFIRTPFTFYEGIRQVPPGTYLKITETDVTEHRWWNPRPYFFSEKRIIPDDAIENALCQSFQRRLVSDVPVGLFLSGGIDSSLVAALLAKRTKQPLPTFTIGFSDAAYDEAPWAAQIAEHLGLPHYTLYISDDELLTRIERLPMLYGQPFGDASALAVDALAYFARQQVKVALSADGGDELFGGYVRHFLRIRPAQWIARGMRLLGLSPSWTAQLLSNRNFHNLPTKLFKLYHFHGRHYGELVQSVPEEAIQALMTSKLPAIPYHSEPSRWDSLSARQYLDLTIYLPDDVLQKVDRATMAYALEAREPFLDPELVEIGGMLPDEDKRYKRVLRRLLSRYLPPSLWMRPKQGFAPPLASWLTGPLQTQLEFFILSEESPLYELGLQRKATQQLYSAFVRGERAFSILFWHLLTLGKWALWYATISPADDNPHPAKSVLASDQHTS
ncbi:MAG: asparagine synthase (glutamine-hydrolyzing) [Bacteroidia bacterium]|nr:asparagine synthase (glutamine-hydrolyzing) [Bacteroidia bacterium]